MFESDKSVPLCIDLDGTLVKEDTSILLLRKFIKQNPFNIFKVLFWFVSSFNNAHVKAKLANNCTLDITKLTFSSLIKNLINQAAQQERKIYLVTGSNQIIAKQITKEIKEFTSYFASDDKINLVGNTKASNLNIKIGKNEYIYAGNSKQDIPVWDNSFGVIVSPFASKKIVQFARKKYKNIIIL